MGRGAARRARTSSSRSTCPSCVRRSPRTATAAQIVTRGQGYELDIDPAQVDAQWFEHLVEVGEAREALALWRGPPLHDVAGEPFAAAEIRRLEELRLTALENAIERDLAAGSHREVVGELDGLVREEPLRERLHAQRMLALYRSGGRPTRWTPTARRGRRSWRRSASSPARSCGACTTRSCGRTRLAAPLADSTATPLVGRDAELDSCGRLAARQEGAGGLVVLAGPARDRQDPPRRRARGRGRAAGGSRGRCARPRGARRRRAARPGAPRARRRRRGALDGLADARAASPALVLATRPLPRRRPQGARHAPSRAARRRRRARRRASYAAGGAGRRIPVQACSRRRRRPRLSTAPAARRGRGGGRGGGARRRRAAGAARGGGRAGRRHRRRAGGARQCEPRHGRPRLPVQGSRLVRCRRRALLLRPRATRRRARCAATGAPLTALVGASGSGKSSVLRAGLVASLAAGVLPGSERWAIALLRPGAHPMRALRTRRRTAAPARGSSSPSTSSRSCSRPAATRRSAPRSSTRSSRRPRPAPARGRAPGDPCRLLRALRRLP